MRTRKARDRKQIPASHRDLIDGAYLVAWSTVMPMVNHTRRLSGAMPMMILCT